MQLKLLHNHFGTLGKTNLGSSSKQYCTPWPWCISQSTINTLKAGHFVNTRQLNCIIFLIIETITFPGHIFASHIAPLWQHYWIHRTHWQHCAYCDVLEAWMGIRNVFKKTIISYIYFPWLYFGSTELKWSPSVENKLSDLSRLIPNYFFNNSL